MRAWARSDGREIGVARAEGEAVGVADDGADDDLRREAQIGDHAAEDGNLGRVLLAEEGAIGFGGDQQLGDHGGDAAKVAGAGCAVQTIAEGWDFDKGGIGAVGIELFDGGAKSTSAPSAAASAQSASNERGIAAEILVGAELRGVDEDADGDVRARGAGGANQRGVAGMQRAHGGNEADGVAGRAAG